MNICSAPITEDDVKALIAGERIGPKTFTWKSGKKGMARLKGAVVQGGDEKDFKVEFDFS